MICPICKHTAIEKEITIFEGGLGGLNLSNMCCNDFDVLGVNIFKTAYNGVKKARLSLTGKKLYKCTNPDCGKEFEA